jgi:hypothetical protein
LDNAEIIWNLNQPEENMRKILVVAFGGEAFFEDLAPGKYCISDHGERLPTTKLTFEVYLSSAQELVAYLGLSKNQGGDKQI